MVGILDTVLVSCFGGDGLFSGAMFGLGGVDVVKGNFKKDLEVWAGELPVNDDQVCPGPSVGYFCLQVVKNSPVVMRMQVFLESRSILEVAVLLLVVRRVQNLSSPV